MAPVDGIVLRASIVAHPEDTLDSGHSANERLNIESQVSVVGSTDTEVPSAILTNWTALDLTDGLPWALTQARVLTSPSTGSLAIAPCALEPSKSYMFTLSALASYDAGTISATASVQINTRAEPYGGNFTASPSSGAALATHFSMRAADWHPGTPDANLSYAFGYLVDSGGAKEGDCAPGAAGLTSLSGTQSAASTSRTLPAGNHTAIVRVYDSTGTSTCSCHYVPIEVYATTVDASVAASAIDAAESLVESDPSAAVSYMAPLADSLEESTALSDEESTMVRERVTSLLAAAGTQLLADAEAGGKAADSTLVDQLSSVLKSTVTTTGALSNATIDSSAGSLAALMAARRDEGVSEASRQNVIEATSSLLSATDRSDTDPEQRTRLFAKLTPLLSTLATKMRDSAVIGEVATVSSESVSVATSKQTAGAVAGRYEAAPLQQADGATTGTPSGSLAVPAGIVEEALAVDGTPPTLIGISLIVSNVNTHKGETDQAMGTPTFDVTFTGDHGIMPMRGLVTPLGLDVPLASPATTRLGAACATDDDCNPPRGMCGPGGTCECAAQYANCSAACECQLELGCVFWDEHHHEWSRYGMTTVEGDGETGTLRCESNHTTEFAGAFLPTSGSEWNADVPTPAVPCTGGWFGIFGASWDENLTANTCVVCISAANVLLLPLFWIRYHRRFKKAKEKIARGLGIRRHLTFRRFRSSGLPKSNEVLGPASNRRRHHGTNRRRAALDLGARDLNSQVLQGPGATRSKSTASPLRRSPDSNKVVPMATSSTMDASPPPSPPPQPTACDPVLHRVATLPSVSNHPVGRLQLCHMLTAGNLHVRADVPKEAELREPSLDELVAQTRGALGPIIRAPQLSNALLRRPPFRFVHDIVSAVARATGFLDGLLEGEEQLAASFKSQENYLSMVIQCVEAALGETLEIRPDMILCGIEPEKTNLFLQALALAATQQKLETDKLLDVLLVETDDVETDEQRSASSFFPVTQLARRATPEQLHPRRPSSCDLRDTTPTKLKHALSQPSMGGAFSCDAPMHQQLRQLATAGGKEVQCPLCRNFGVSLKLYLPDAGGDDTVASSCPVCLDKFEYGLKVLSCGHVFCQDCVDNMPARPELPLQAIQDARVARRVRTVGETSNAARPPLPSMSTKPSLYSQSSLARLTRLTQQPSFKRVASTVSSSAKKAGSKTIEVTRDRHTVVSVTHPLDIDIDDPTHLRDEQFLQIFFNVLIMELLMGCVWANAITITSNGALHLRNLMIVGFSTAILQIFVVIISRAFIISLEEASSPRAMMNAARYLRLREPREQLARAAAHQLRQRRASSVPETARCTMLHGPRRPRETSARRGASTRPAGCSTFLRTWACAGSFLPTRSALATARRTTWSFRGDTALVSPGL